MQTRPEAVADTDVLIDVRGLEVHYGLRGGSLARLLGRESGTVRAIDGIDLRLRQGEVLGLVGESGSGKTTLGRALLGLAPATNGEILFRDRDIAQMGRRERREVRRHIQMAFQDPNAALNPSMTIEQAVGDALRVHGVSSAAERRARVVETLERVGLSPVELFLTKYPRDLSGGQKQRVVLARSIILGPDVLVADEPISMLDMSVRAKILQLMLDLKQDLGLTYVYITHDLASAKYFCDRIAIMYLGRIVEIGPTEEIFANPRHPYTQALLRAIPDPDPDRAVARDLPRGEIPDAAAPPTGCSFHPRCPVAVAECGWEGRDLRTMLETHWTRATPEEYVEQAAVLGDLSHLDAPAEHVVHLGSGGAQPVRELLDAIRTVEDDPFWRGVDEITDEGAGVRLRFREGVDPALRLAGGVDVACVLYPEAPPATGGADG